jgi:guanylate kinase
MSEPIPFYSHPHEPLLIVISGPSGVGKDTVLQRMKERMLPMHFVVTATTRPPRNDEREGIDYFFVSHAEFARMIEQGELLEYAYVYNDYKGIPRAQIDDALESGQDVIMRLDVQGAATMRKLYSGALLIFLTTENEEDLVHRLEKRNSEKTDERDLRIAMARRELNRINEFDYVLVNAEDQLDETVDLILSIIHAEHHNVIPRKIHS